MGYTHNWTGKPATTKNFKVFVDTCKQLHDALPEQSDTAGGYYSDEPIVICGDDGTGLPEFSKEKVAFNGTAEDEMMHESFWILKGGEVDFCKTNRKPYDLLVCACLIAAKEILGYDVSSNGEEEEWQDAINLYKEIIDPQLEFRLEKWNNVQIR